MDLPTILKIGCAFLASILTISGIMQFRFIFLYFKSKVPAKKTGLDYVLLDFLLVVTAHGCCIPPIQIMGLFLKPYLTYEATVLITL